MEKTVIQTELAPQAIGTYSQGIRCGNMVFLSGQIPLNSQTMELVDTDPAAMIKQVFDNLSAVAEAAGGSLQHIVKLMIYLTDMQHYALVNEIMRDYFQEPYPARAAVAVAALPKGALIEMDAILAV